VTTFLRSEHIRRALRRTDDAGNLRDGDTASRDQAAQQELGRFGQSEEIASAAAFLLSSDAPFITGHALIVDGGYTAGRDHDVTKMLGL
jgi:NAD(P)-dependent dehydrogenase (short-subunit alcohol dehydrogenase family)